MTDIYDRLKQDHDEQRELIKKIEATDGNTDERQKLYKSFREEALAHANAEEIVFYSAMMQTHDGQDKARHSVAEHKEMDDVIEELDKLEFSNSGWMTKFRQLSHLLIHHVDEEEDEIFVCAKEVISAADAKAMVPEFDKKKARQESEV